METGKVLNKKTREARVKEEKKRTKDLFQSIAFYLDDQIYAMDVMDIDSIITVRKIYKVPNTNEKVLGVLNLRGNILPIYSLKLILGLEDPFRGRDVIDDEDRYIVMIKKGRDIFGIMIDSIYNNISATEENFRKGTNFEKWSKNDLFKGVILDGTKEILVTNIDNLLKYMISLK